MNTKRNTKRVGTWSLSTINYSRLTINSAQRAGISLMEVLASVFVIGVGLLGVLAVIPFGVFQVSKVNHADYCSNMLQIAAAEIRVREMAKPKTWSTAGASIINSNGGTSIYNDTGLSAVLNCTRFIMVDPFDTGDVDPSPSFPNPSNPPDFINPNYKYKIGRFLLNAEAWCNVMRDHDDIQYTLEEGQRPDWRPAGRSTPLSSGQYTWFFTFKPKPKIGSTAPLNQVPVAEVEPTVSVDILACYNRSPGDEVMERMVRFRIDSSVNDYTPLLSGAQITLRSNSQEHLDLSRTKWIFVMWPTHPSVPPLLSDPAAPVDGHWCKVVSVGQLKENLPPATALGTQYSRTVTLVAGLPSSLPLDSGTSATTGYAFIVDGTLYHERIDNVRITDN